MPFRFLAFTLDNERRELFCNGDLVPLSPKVFDLLSFLVAERHRMVPKAELMDRFWSLTVGEAALQKTISQLRKALGATPDGAAAIRTYHGRGLRFVAPVDEFVADVGQAPADSAARTFGERPLAAILCVLLGNEGSTSAANGSIPAEAELSDRFRRARTAVDRHGGVLLNVMIDGFTAAFGVDPVSDDGARRAAHCAAELARGRADDPGPGMALGIDLGPMDASPEDGWKDWALPGEIERRATALARGAGPGNVVLSDGIVTLLGDEIETEPTVATGADVAPGVRLVSVAPIHAGIPARPRKHPVRFVGRRAEMTFLAAQHDLLRSGAGRAVTLCGPAGIGKTRLVTEFLASLDPDATRVVVVHCLPSLAKSPLEPIRMLCLALTRDGPGEGVVRDPIDDALLRELLGGQASDALGALSDHQRRARGAALVGRLLSANGRKRPLIVVFEDVHWLDATSLDLVHLLAREADRRPALFVLTTRPGTGDDPAPLAESVLHLSTLGHAESLELLRDAASDVALAPDAAEALLARADGNPFFIEELALAAQAGGDPAVGLPRTVQAVITVRIGALRPSLRALVYIIAVAGPPAPRDLVAHLAQRSAQAVEEDVAALTRMGFLEVQEDGHTFRHMLIADTAYAMLASGDRRRLHGEISGYLETADPPPPPERLAWHLQEAGAPERAVPLWAAASRAALHRAARQEAVGFAEAGLALLADGDEATARAELDLLLCLAPALTALKGFGFADVGRAYARADALNARIGNPRAEIRIRVGLWIHTWVRGQLTRSLEHADKLLDLAGRMPDPALALQARASRGQVLMHRGALAEALGDLAEGLAAIDGAAPATAPAQNAAVSCAAYASWTARLMGRDAEADLFMAQSKRLSALRDNPFAAAIHTALGTGSFMAGGDEGMCLAYSDEAIAISREHDFVFWLGTGLVSRGWALARRRDWDDAFAAFDEGIAVLEATHAGVQLANWHGLRAEALLGAGSVAQAHVAAVHALGCADRAEDLFFTQRIHSVAAEALDRLGRQAEADAHRRDAARLARGFGMDARMLRLELA